MSKAREKLSRFFDKGFSSRLWVQPGFSARKNRKITGFAFVMLLLFCLCSKKNTFGSRAVYLPVDRAG